MALSSLMIAAGLLAACDAQVDPTYRAADFQVIGRIENDRACGCMTPSVEVSFVWQTLTSKGLAGPERFPIAWETPARFTVELFGPAPEAALTDLTLAGRHPEESQIAVALLGATAAPAGTVEAALLGAAERDALVYVAGDVVPGTLSERLLGGPLHAGYHMMSVEHVSEPDKQLIRDCQAALAPGVAAWRACGLPTDLMFKAADAPPSVRLVDEASDLDLPELMEGGLEWQG